MSVPVLLSVGILPIQWPERPSNLVVFVEDPAVGLAAAMASGAESDPAQWIAVWCADAQRVLRHAHRDPSRCLLVDADEARRVPQAFAQACRERFGADVPLPSASDQPLATDPLSLALAEALLFADRQAQALLAELQASCALLDAHAFSALPVSTSLRIDGAAAVRRLQGLHADQQAAAQAAAGAARESLTLSAQVAEQTAAVQAGAQQLKALQARLDQAEAQGKAALAENELMLLQLHQVQEELEQQYLQCRAFETELAARVPAAELQAAQKALTQAKAASDQTAAERVVQIQQLTQARDQQAKLAAEQTKLAADRQAKLDQYDKQLKVSAQENELMLLQLHQVQEELEHYYLECRKLEAAAASIPSMGLIEMSAAEVLPVTERAAWPHRELTFTLRQVRVAERAIPEATVRLVEHHGHPGLVVFGSGQNPPLLASWQQSGEEDGQPYSLLIPSDANSLPIFSAMDSTDWLVTQTLAALFEKRLSDPSLQLAAHWKQLARRLREQLQEMPCRFRFGSLDVAPVGEPGCGELAFNFDQVHCGARQLPRLSVHWQPLGPQAGLVLLCGPDGVPPLPTWPDDEHGAVPDRLHLPLGSGVSPQDQRHCWQRLMPADLQFVQALLAAWPGALSRVPADLLGGEAQAQRLTQVAASLSKQAQTTLAGKSGGFLSRLTGGGPA
jgi:chemotaxis protein histidine kinase CheA